MKTTAVWSALGAITLAASLEAQTVANTISVTCTPQELTSAPVGSCGYRLKTILVVQSAEDWRRDDAMTITNLMAA